MKFYVLKNISVQLNKPVVVDAFTEIPEMGRFIEEGVGHQLIGGIILE